MSPSEVIRLGRTIAHLGMVPQVRIIELSRGPVQSLLDGGFQIVVLPDIRNAEMASQFVQTRQISSYWATGCLYYQRRHKLQLG